MLTPQRVDSTHPRKANKSKHLKGFWLKVCVPVKRLAPTESSDWSIQMKRSNSRIHKQALTQRKLKSIRKLCKYVEGLVTRFWWTLKKLERNSRYECSNVDSNTVGIISDTQYVCVSMNFLHHWTTAIEKGGQTSSTIHCDSIRGVCCKVVCFRLSTV